MTGWISNAAKGFERSRRNSRFFLATSDTRFLRKSEKLNMVFVREMKSNERFRNIFRLWSVMCAWMCSFHKETFEKIISNLEQMFKKEKYIYIYLLGKTYKYGFLIVEKFICMMWASPSINMQQSKRLWMSWSMIADDDLLFEQKKNVCVTWTDAPRALFFSVLRRIYK